jgi:YgiT-type zinc finger domain-containing protein
MIQCVFCNTDNVKEVKTDYTRNIKGRRILVKNVPALYCESCGDYFYHAKVLRQIHEKIDKSLSKPENLDVYDYSNEISEELYALVR